MAVRVSTGGQVLSNWQRNICRSTLAQRIYAPALGYEDLDDHDKLRNDAALAVPVGKEDPEGKKRFHRRDRDKALAGESTLNRLESGRARTR